MIDQFKRDVVDGLSQTQKTLPSKYFYDKKGDALFQQIMAMPEYYLTRAEMDIFKNKTDELIQSLHINSDESFELIELGAGDGTKTIHLLKGLLERNYTFEYLPIDISQNTLDGLETMLARELSTLSIKPKQGDYFDRLEDLKKSNIPKFVLVLGSNIGNLIDEKAAKFIYNLGAYLNPNDRIILGVDLIKEVNIVLPAYNDAQGITAEFNLNLLDRINKEIGANFNRDNFQHAAEYTLEEGIAKSYLVSNKKHSVNIANKEFHFEKGERIHTEISRKYNDEIIDKILSSTDLVREVKIMDSNAMFADYILKRK